MEKYNVGDIVYMSRKPDGTLIYLGTIISFKDIPCGENFEMINHAYVKLHKGSIIFNDGYYPTDRLKRIARLKHV